MALSVNWLSRRSLWKWTTTWILGVGLVLWLLQWKPWLNERERRLIGIWTWQDEPGEMTLHYRDDGTMLYLDRPTFVKDRITFTRWHIKGNELVVEYAPRSVLNHLAQKLVMRSRFGASPMTIHFQEDGTVHHRMSDGKTRVLIPWKSDVGESLRYYEK